MSSRPATFQKLGLDESMNKLKLALSGHSLAHLEVWEHGPEGRRLAHLSNFQEVKMASADAGRPALELPLNTFSSEGLESSSVVVLLSVGKLHYLALAKVAKMAKCWKLSLLEGLHRPEGRRDERLLTYPHHQAVVYFLIQKAPTNNVISFNRSENRQKDDYSKFKHENLKDVLASFGVEHVSEGVELMELRAIDLSPMGLSVMANGHEVQALQGKGQNAFLSLNGEKVILPTYRVVHQVSFLDAHSQSQRAVEWFKVGLELASKTVEYENLIDKYLDEKLKAVVRGEFAQYVDKSKK